MNTVPEYENIRWWHSIDLGNGVITPGRKSADLLRQEFENLRLTAEFLQGKRVLDIGCNDGFMSLMCESLGAEVVAVDGIVSDGLKYVRNHFAPKFEFYSIDIMSSSFFELGRYDIILYLGLLYHTIYPFEQLLRIAGLCNPGTILFLESEYMDLEGYESHPTIIYNYDGQIHVDSSSPAFPSIAWIENTLAHVGFKGITLLQKTAWETDHRRGRVTIQGTYSGITRPLLYAAEQLVR
jgi:tRNA (mo5U34)-methyltransferase